MRNIYYQLFVVIVWRLEKQKLLHELFQHSDDHSYISHVAKHNLS